MSSPQGWSHLPNWVTKRRIVQLSIPQTMISCFSDYLSTVPLLTVFHSNLNLTLSQPALGRSPVASHPSINFFLLLPATVSNFSCPFFSSSSSPSAIVFRLPLFVSSHNNVWLRRVCCYISTMTTVKHLLSLSAN